MRISVERLRLGLLVGAGLLVLVIAAFLGYARYRVHRALVNLPGKMGATITKEFNGYTWSQSDGKRTIFTMHAAKAVQHKDGKYTLHDVNMILYGHKGDRADRISGDQFEYDTSNEVVTAVGIVHLDLQGPAPADPNSEASKHLAPVVPATDNHNDAVGKDRLIHVKTSGLVYMKKLGVAATKEGVEFAFGGFTGHAVGAEYSSDTGHLVLQSAITVSGLDKGRPIALSSSHGELDRANNLANFNNARYVSAGDIAQADMAHIHVRNDGTVERVEAERHVSLVQAGQSNVTSDRADIALDTNNKPKTAVLTGSVHFNDEEPLRQAHGESDRANLNFDGQGHVNHAILQGRVHAVEQLKTAGDTTRPLSERNLATDNLELSFAAERAGTKPQLREVIAKGGAQLRSLAPAPGSACGPATAPCNSASSTNTNSTKMLGDMLDAHLVSRNGVAELSTVHGAGHTSVQQVSATGVDQTSSGDSLDATFREVTKEKGRVELATAVQQGSVVIDRRSPPKKAGDPVDLEHAVAGKAAFDADSDRMTLNENVQLNDAGRSLQAAHVVIERTSGDATADGGVKVSYVQTESAEPVHILAARADLKHEAGRATFYGGSAPARMWQAGTGTQGGSQIEAPVLVFEQALKRLSARAETPGVTASVHAVLADGSTNKPAVTNVKSATPAKPLRQGVARITSTEMVYSDIQRQAEFTGGVRVLDASGEMRGQQATVYLAPATTGGKKPAADHNAAGSTLTGLLGGSVEKIVATQHIEITQPGRRATGDRLVYTADDQMFVLTGTAAAPPKVVDEQQGTTTGTALRFHSGDDSVVVSGGHNDDAPAQKVHTETRVKQ